MRCNEAVFSSLLHDGINLDEAKGGQQVPLKDFTVKNDYLSDHFLKDFEGDIKTHLQETMSCGFTCKCMM